VTALKISRVALLVSALAWGLLLILGWLQLIDPLLALGFGGYAAIAIALSAAACVFFQA